MAMKKKNKAGTGTVRKTKKTTTTTTSTMTQPPSPSPSPLITTAFSGLSFDEENYDDKENYENDNDEDIMVADEEPKEPQPPTLSPEQLKELEQQQQQKHQEREKAIEVKRIARRACLAKFLAHWDRVHEQRHEKYRRQRRELEAELRKCCAEALSTVPLFLQNMTLEEVEQTYGCNFLDEMMNPLFAAQQPQKKQTAAVSNDAVADACFAQPEPATVRCTRSRAAKNGEDNGVPSTTLAPRTRSRPATKPQKSFTNFSTPSQSIMVNKKGMAASTTVKSTPFSKEWRDTGFSNRVVFTERKGAITGMVLEGNDNNNEGENLIELPFMQFGSSAFSPRSPDVSLLTEEQKAYLCLVQRQLSKVTDKIYRHKKEADTPSVHGK